MRHQPRLRQGVRRRLHVDHRLGVRARWASLRHGARRRQLGGAGDLRHARGRNDQRVQRASARLPRSGRRLAGADSHRVRPMGRTLVDAALADAGRRRSRESSRPQAQLVAAPEVQMARLTPRARLIQSGEIDAQHDVARARRSRRWFRRPALVAGQRTRRAGHEPRSARLRSRRCARLQYERLPYPPRPHRRSRSKRQPSSHRTGRRG